MQQCCRSSNKPHEKHDIIVYKSYPLLIMNSPPTTVLLVDGYNVIAAWPALSQLMQQSLADARHSLLETLASYSAYKGYRSIVVFDAHGQPSAAVQAVLPSGVETYYTSYNETADTVIERYCAQWQWEEWRVRVATSDRLIQLMAMGYDADWISAQNLQSEVKAVQKEIRNLIQAPPKPRQRKPKTGKQEAVVQRGIEGALDAETRNLLRRFLLDS